MRAVPRHCPVIPAFASSHAGLKRWFSIGAAALAIATAEVRAQVIISHSGSTDPATEGWTRTSPTSGNVGAVTNDLGAGTAAWHVDDNSTVATNYYNFTPSGSLIAQGAAQGWTMSATMRLTTSAPHIGFMGFGYQDGTKDWEIYAEQTAGNDFVVRFYGVGAPSFALSGQGNDYHTISMVFDPGSSTVDVFIDGVERISNFAGATYEVTQIFFGGGSSNNMGEANYSAVQFSAVPEPSTTAAILGAVALAGVAVVRRGRR